MNKKEMEQKQWNPVWYTIPEFSHIRTQNPYHREQESMRMDVDAPKNVHVLVRSEIWIEEKGGRQYLLDITADDYYKLYVNGHFAGQGPAPAYPEQYYYNIIDITSWLQEGKNVLAVHLYYQGLVNRVWNSGDGRFAMAARLRAGMSQAETLREEKSRESRIPLVWRYQICHAYSGDTVGYETQFLENFDSRLWKDDWIKPEYQNSGWQEMEPAVWADYCLIPQPVEMLEIYEQKPEVIKRTGKNRWFLDAGKEVTGGLILTASGVAGSRVILTYGEELLHQKETGLECVRWQMRCNCDYREEWILGDGISRYIPYDYKGFRYVQIETEQGVELLDMLIRIQHYPADTKLCSLKTSAPYVADIFHICKRAVILGTQEGYLDCPTREKGQYLGDAVITSRSQVWLTGKTDMLRKCISQFAWTEERCPGLLGVAPGSLMQEIADFSLLWSQLLLTDYQFTGDREFLRQYYPTARRIIAYFAQFEREDGLLDCVSEKWNLVDWPENLRDQYEFPLTRPVVAKGCHNVINALYVGAMKVLSELEKILRYPQTYDWERKRNAFVRAFYKKDRGLFADREQGEHCALHSNLYPLYFGFVPEKAKTSAAEFLIGKGLECGTMTSFYLLKALAKAGYHQEMYRLMVNNGPHGWVNMLREGATACFETWGKDQKWNTSLCHPWSSAPVSILIEDIAGIHLSPEHPDGYEFVPHIPEEVEDFALKVPFRDKVLYVRKQNKMVWLERI